EPARQAVPVADCECTPPFRASCAVGRAISHSGAGGYFLYKNEPGTYRDDRGGLHVWARPTAVQKNAGPCKIAAVPPATEDARAVRRVQHRRRFDGGQHLHRHPESVPLLVGGG